MKSACALVLLSSCVLRFPLPEGEPQISCVNEGDCPAPLRCNVSTQRCLPPERLDGVAPALLEPATITPSLSRRARVKLRFRVSEPLREAPLVTFDRVRASWTFVSVSDDPQPIYDYELTPGDEVPQGTFGTRATLVDPAGNTSEVDLGASVTFDFDAPALQQPTFTLVSPLGDDAAVATIGSVLRFDFAVSEALGTLPTVNGAAATTSVDGYVFEQAISSEPTDKTYVVRLVDAAGNTSETTVPWALTGNAITFDTTPPPAPDTTKLVLVRTPWGSFDDGTLDRATLLGPPGSAEPFVTVALREPLQTTERLHLKAGEDGALPANMLADVAHLEVQARDAAGNVSPWTPITHVRWRAALGEKKKGSVAKNPHRFAAQGTLLPARADLPGAEEIDALGGALLDGDGGPQTSATAFWEKRDVTADLRPRIMTEALAYDPLRARFVLFGGLVKTSASDLVFERIRGAWTEMTLSDPEGDGSPGPMRFAGAAFHSPTAKLIVFDGETGFTWSYDGASFKRECAGCTAPPPRMGFGLTADRRRGVLVLFGGEKLGTWFNDVWEWDGARWTEVCTTAPCSDGKPAGRWHHAQAYDGRETMVFGGGNASGFLQDTFTFDGARWLARCTTSCTPPPAQQSAAAAFDPTFPGVVMMGGSGNVWPGCPTPPPLTPELDVWRFDGETWTALTVAASPDGSPVARAFARLAYDPARRAFVMTPGADVTCFAVPGQDDSRTDWWELSVRGAPAWRYLGATQSAATTDDRQKSIDSTRKLAVDHATAEVLSYRPLASGTPAFSRWTGSAWISLPAPTGLSDQSTALFFDGANDGVWLREPASGAERRFESRAWTTPVTDVAFGARDRPAIGADGGDTLVLYGGNGNNDTWVNDGSGWSQACLSPACTVTPAAVSNAALARDRTGRAILAGGTMSGPRDPNTYAYDGTDWIVLPTGPQGRLHHGLVYDEDREETVLIGGTTSTSVVPGVPPTQLRDVWGFDGTQWREWAVRDLLGDGAPRDMIAFDYAFSRDDGAIVRGGDTLVSPSATPPTWLLHGEGHGRPAHVFTVDTSDIAALEIASVRVRWSGAGNAIQTNGLSLWAWRVDHWHEVATTSGGVIDWTLDFPLAELISGTKLRFALTPSSENGNAVPLGTIATDSVLVEIDAVAP